MTSSCAKPLRAAISTRARISFAPTSACCEDAQGIEARQRREGLIRHEDELVDFFRGKLPQEIASSRALDAWYRHARPAEQAALRWSMDDVMVGGSGLDPKAFPASLDIPPQRYRLEYRFVPGDDADGVTLHLPLAMLNALPAARCEWLVPGLLGEKVAELIRGLPKALRRNFVPAPDFARAFVEAETPRDEPLSKVLAAFLRAHDWRGNRCGRFRAGRTAAAFAMRYRLHDENGKHACAAAVILPSIARAMGRAGARGVLAQDRYRTHARRRRPAGISKRFPSKCDPTAACWLFPRWSISARPLRCVYSSAATKRRRRICKAWNVCCATRLASDMKQARRRLPIANALSLKYAPLGSVDGLREDLVEGGFTDLLATQRFECAQRCRLRGAAHAGCA